MRDGEVDPVKVIDENSSSQEPCNTPSASADGVYPLRCHDRLSNGIEEHSNFWRIRVVSARAYRSPVLLYMRCDRRKRWGMYGRKDEYDDCYHKALLF
jgi:hypothetical protein